METIKGTVAQFMRDTLAAEVAYIYPHAVTFMLRKRIKLSKQTDVTVNHWHIYRIDVKVHVRRYGLGEDYHSSEYIDNSYCRIVVHDPKQLSGIPKVVTINYNVASETLRSQGRHVNGLVIDLASGHRIDITSMDGLSSDWSPQTTLSDNWIKPQPFPELLKGHKDNYKETFDVLDMTGKPECYHFDTYDTVHRPNCNYDCRKEVPLELSTIN